MAEGPSRWRFGLRERLLAVTLGVAVVAIVLTAWAVNRQTESELRGAVDRELREPGLVYTTFLTASQTNPRMWSNTLELAQLASFTANEYGLRVRLEYASDGNLIHDTGQQAGPDPGAPNVSPLVLTAPAQAIDQLVENSYRECLLAADIVLDTDDGEPNDDGTGVERYVPRKAAVNETDAAQDAIGRCDAAKNAERAELHTEDLLLYVYNPSLDELATIGDSTNSRLLLTVLGVVLVALVASMLAGRHILRPIIRLTRASRRMASGHLDERVPEGRGDELGDLSVAFNSMASSLEAATQQRQRMTSDIAHELRTPLSNIRGYLEAAQDGVAPLTPALIDSLHEDTLLLQTLVSDLQELTVAEAGGLLLHRSPIDLDDLAASVVGAHLARAQGAGIELRREGEGRLVADVDPQRLRQVLTNLVENALRHTPSGGTVTVRSLDEGAQALVEVADTGSGIAAEHLPHVFERFYRADASRNRSTGGSGLGLAITRELVRAHGGTISVDSEVGRGTTFQVRLPRGGDAPPAASPPSPPTAATNSHTNGAGRRAARTEPHDRDHVHVS